METVCTRKDGSAEFQTIKAGACIWSKAYGVCIKTDTGDSIVNLRDGNFHKVGYLEKFFVVKSQLSWELPHAE